MRRINEKVDIIYKKYILKYQPITDVENNSLLIQRGEVI